MAKRKMSENSLKNLEKSKGIFATDKELARKAKIKSDEAKKEKKLLQQVAEEKLNKRYSDGTTFQEKSLDLIEEYILTGIVKPDDLIKMLTFLRDTAGQKPTDKQEVIGNLGIEKVFITPKEAKQTDKHIDDVINE